MPAKYLCRIDRHEKSFTAGQHRALESANLRSVEMLAALLPHWPADSLELDPQRHWLKIVDGHAAGERDDPFLSVYLAHRFIQNRRDDPAVHVAWRPFKSARQAKPALHDALRRVFLKFKAQPLHVASGTAETMVRQASQDTAVLADMAGRFLRL